MVLNIERTANFTGIFARHRFRCNKAVDSNGRNKFGQLVVSEAQINLGFGTPLLVLQKIFRMNHVVNVFFTNVDAVFGDVCEHNFGIGNRRRHLFRR